MTTDKTKEIAALNDLFRTGANPALGMQFVTRGISELPIVAQAQILQKILTFKDFTEDNNPHGERDFGAFEHAKKEIFWKIDYYDGDDGTLQSSGLRVQTRLNRCHKRTWVHSHLCFH